MFRFGPAVQGVCASQDVSWLQETCFLAEEQQRILDLVCLSGLKSGQSRDSHGPHGPNSAHCNRLYMLQGQVSAGSVYSVAKDGRKTATIPIF